MSGGHIALERSLDSIRVGVRHRAELGDIDALSESIKRHGLLQPITVTPEGTLVCGARRLLALQRLGIRTTNVWVRAGVSDELSRQLAEQDENTLHKPLTPTESASLYRELKSLLAEDAARRQRATQFGQPAIGQDDHGAATLAAPGDARAQAALLITGRRSYTTLERIGELQEIAADASLSSGLREQASAELYMIDQGGPVTPALRRVKREPERDQMDTGAQVDRTQPAAPADLVLPARAFVFLWSDLRDWWRKFDVDVLARELTDAQWEQFELTLECTREFARRLRDRRALLK